MDKKIYRLPLIILICILSCLCFTGCGYFEDFDFHAFVMEKVPVPDKLIVEESGNRPGNEGQSPSAAKEPSEGSGVISIGIYQELSDKKAGVCIGDFDDPFMKEYRAVLTPRLLELGFKSPNITIRDGKGKQENQTKQVFDFINSDVDVLIVDPIRNDGIDVISDLAAAAGIPLVFIGDKPDEEEIKRWEEEEYRICYVGADHDQRGTKQGEILKDIIESSKGDLSKVDLNGNGTIDYAILKGKEEEKKDSDKKDSSRDKKDSSKDKKDSSKDKNDSSKDKKDAGKDNESEKSFPKDIDFDIDNLAVKPLEDLEIKPKKIDSKSGANTREEGKELTEKLLTKYSTEMEIIFCNDDEMAKGAADAIKEAGRKCGRDILLISYGGFKPDYDGVKNGELTGTVYHNPGKFVEISAMAAVNFIMGAANEYEVNYNYIKVTPVNVGDM